MDTRDCDVCIVGAGTAGMAAAYALKKSGYRVVLVEKYSRVGGTAVNAWVEVWIEGINPPYLVEIYNSLQSVGKAWGDIDMSWLPQKFINSGKSSFLRFDPDALAEKYVADLNAAGNITILSGYTLSTVYRDNNCQNVSSIEIANIKDANDVIQINAQWFIDSSGDGILCRQAGCTAYLGEDCYEKFHEEFMKDKVPQKIINEPSLLFRVEEQPSAISSSFDGDNPKDLPFVYDGYIDLFHSWINPMTGMGISGMEVICRGINKTYEKAYGLINDFWAYIEQQISQRKQRNPEPLYGYASIKDLKYVPTGEYAPMLGIRESYRIECERMLIQSDLKERINSAALENFIACGSDEVDLHVYGSISQAEVQAFNKKELQPSGIPYQCLIPKNLDNVLVACRAYGASHIALAAHRINKDMAQIGWAAGHAIRICLEEGLTNTRGVDVEKLQGSSYTNFTNSVKELEKRMK
jgi:hypothetical protein